MRENKTKKIIEKVRQYESKFLTLHAIAWKIKESTNNVE